MNALHLSKSNSWMTPADILASSRTVLDDIDLDPASSGPANLRVRANTFFDEGDDALRPGRIWFGSVFLNPPGGKRGKESLTGLFWQKLMEERDAGHVSHAIFLAFSLEALSMTQKYHVTTMLSFPLCVPQTRLRFLTEYSEEVMSEEDFVACLTSTELSAATMTKAQRLTWAKNIVALAKKTDVEPHPAAGLILDRYAAQPTHGNVIVYVPGNIDRTAVFKEEFSKYGAVR
jgi:hypothetical protein